MHACAAQEHAYDHEAVDWLMENCPTVVQMFEGLCTVYADRTMFGFCDPGSDKWQTISYRQFHERVVQFSAGVPAACCAQILTTCLLGHAVRQKLVLRCQASQHLRI